MNEDKTKKDIPIWIWLVGCVAVLAICGVVLVVGLSVTMFFFASSTTTAVSTPAVSVVTVEVATVSPPSTNEPDTPDPQPTATNILPQTPTPSPAGGDNPLPEEDEDAHALIRTEIEANVVEIRGLEPQETVQPLFMTSAELRQQLEADLAEDYSQEESRQDALVLSAFDFLDPDFNLYDFTLDPLTEQVAGYYDTETKEFVLIGDDAEFDVLEQWTHAHEYTHALQDQYFDLDLLGSEELDSEAAFALRALAEGDATLVQTSYLLDGYFSQGQLLEILTSVGEIETTVFDTAPPILARELEFPYSEGLNFAQTLYADGGFAAVNSAWENLPQSTEQILHPDRYLTGDNPQIVSLAPLTETLGLGWQRLDEDIFGEFYLREYLGQQLEASEVTAAATGWGGDRYAVYWNEENDQLVMVLRLVWDTAVDSQEFSSAYANYPARLFGSQDEEQPNGGRCWAGPDDLICLYQLGEETIIVRAPDQTTAATVINTIIE